MRHQYGDLDLCLICATDRTFVESSSGQVSRLDGFCPEDLQACLQPARTTAAQIMDAMKSYSKAHATQLKPLLSWRNLLKHRLPEQGITYLGRSGKSFTETFSSAKPTFLVLSDQTLSATGGRECIPQPCNELNNSASQNPLQKGILAWQLFLKWICRNSKAL